MWVEIKEHGYKSKQVAVMKADRLGCYTVDSDKRGITYIFSGDEMAIVTNDGYFRTDLDSAKSVAVEILALLEDRKDLKRMGGEIMKFFDFFAGNSVTVNVIYEIAKRLEL